MIDVITYREHRKELLKDKKVRAEYERLLPRPRGKSGHMAILCTPTRWVEGRSFPAA